MTPNFIWPVRVYYEDTDAGGVVYHSNFLKFLERARTEWLRAADIEQDVLAQQEGLIFAVRSLSIEYLQPAFFNQALWVTVAPTERRRASVVLQQEIYRAALPASASPSAYNAPLPAPFDLLSSAACLCRAHVRLAVLERATLRPRPVPSCVAVLF